MLERASISRAMILAIVCIACTIPRYADAAEDANAATAKRSAEDVLQQAKLATGGNAWDALRSQHSRVRLDVSGRQGTAERWASLTTGRSRLRYDLGAGETGVIGYDGFVLWIQDATGHTEIERDPQLIALAVNTAYRDRLGFWYPERHTAKLEYEGQQRADGADFDVVRITPEGGVGYEVWASATTHRIERLREPEPGGRTRTEVYSDFRPVQGVTVPFTVQTSHGDPKFDEHYSVDSIEYNAPLGEITFEPPK